MGLINTAIQTGSQILGMIGQNTREKRAMDNQKELMSIQFNNQKQLDKYGQELQLDTWNKTNYPSQVKMLKEAGLNPSLLYGHSGPGGTTGSQTGGTASSGSAPSPQQMPMELGNALLMSAQIKLLNAQAKQAEAQAEKTKGVDTIQVTESINKIKAETTNENLKSRLIELQSDLNDIEKSYKPYLLEASLNNVLQNTLNTKQQFNLTDAQFESIVIETKQKAIGQSLQNALISTENELKKANINYTNSQINQISETISQRWREIGQTDEKILIDTFEAEFKVNNPNASAVIGSIAKKAYTSVKNIELFITNWFNKNQIELNPLIETVK